MKKSILLQTLMFSQFCILSSVQAAILAPSNETIEQRIISLNLHSDLFAELLQKHAVENIIFHNAYISGSLQNGNTFMFDILPTMMQTSSNNKFAISNNYTFKDLNPTIRSRCMLVQLTSHISLNQPINEYLKQPTVTINFEIDQKNYSLQYPYKP